MNLLGLMEQPGSEVPIIRISKCQEKYLTPGQSCMSAAELQNYFNGDRRVRLIYSHTFVDYDDIETPVKSTLKGTASIVLHSDKKVEMRYTLETHEFRDMTEPLQIVAEETTTTYLNLLDNE